MYTVTRASVRMFAVTISCGSKRECRRLDGEHRPPLLKDDSLASDGGGVDKGGGAACVTEVDRVRIRRRSRVRRASRVACSLHEYFRPIGPSGLISCLRFEPHVST